MRVLIVNPAFARDVGAGLERYQLGAGMRFPWSLLKRHDERPRYAMFPLFLAYAAALLEREGFEVRVVDAVPLNLRVPALLERIVECRPDLVLLEPNAANVEDTLELLRRVRARCDARVVLAGTHATATARDLLAGDGAVDFVLIGEYEEVAVRLAAGLRDGHPVQALAGVACRRGDGHVVVNPRAPAIEPLDDLPPPARHLFPAYFDGDMSVYRDGFCQFGPAFHMHTSRGCPFRCNFCDRIQVLFGGGRQRYFSPRRIVDEMEQLKAAGAREIYFDDDNFTSSRAHVVALCDEIARRRVGVAWSAMCDAIALTPPLLRRMADAGCVGIKFGLDSADARVLQEIRKPLKLANLEGVVAAARSLRLKTHMSVVLGLTGETRQTLRRTFDYACAIDVDSVQFSIATPLPGTSMHETLVAQGALGATRWSDYDGANTAVMRYDDLSADELEAFMALSHSRWLRAKFRQPRWVLRQLRFVARTASSQGWRGVWTRLARAAQLLGGDARRIRLDGEFKSVRY